jgi:hypothetical protein
MALHGVRMTPLNAIWIIATTALATVFALAGIAIAADAVRSWHRTLGTTLGLASGMLIAVGFVTVALLVLHWAVPSTG